jgi:hypothetical protein
MKLKKSCLLHGNKRRFYSTENLIEKVDHLQSSVVIRVEVGAIINDKDEFDFKIQK